MQAPEMAGFQAFPLRYLLGTLRNHGKGARNLTVSFSAHSLTHFGGEYLLHRFFARLGLLKALTNQVRFAQRNARYSI